MRVDIILKFVLKLILIHALDIRFSISFKNDFIRFQVIVV